MRGRAILSIWILFLPGLGRGAHTKATCRGAMREGPKDKSLAFKGLALKAVFISCFHFLQICFFLSFASRPFDTYSCSTGTLESKRSTSVCLLFYGAMATAMDGECILVALSHRFSFLSSHLLYCFSQREISWQVCVWAGEEK